MAARNSLVFPAQLLILLAALLPHLAHAQPVTITASPTQIQTAVPGAAFRRPLQVTITAPPAGAPIGGITVTFNAPAAGATATLSSPTAVTNATGTASVTAIANGTVGSYTVTATATAQSVPLSASFSLANLPAAAVTLVAPPGPSVFGAPVTLTATMTPSTAAGRVTFYDGQTILGTKPVSGGATSLSTIMLPAGNRKLTAYYSGTNQAGARSNTVTHTVNGAAVGSFITNNINSSLDTIGSVAVGDFNGDGKPDLAVTDGFARGGSRISILLGKGDGTFQTPIIYTVGAFMGSVIVGDFNGDGNTDLAVFYGGFVGDGFAPPNTTAILLGNGDGTFHTAGTVNFGGPAIVADVNGDGNADLVGYDVVLFGNGDGTFGPPVTLLASLQSSADRIAIADFNNDGVADAVIACSTCGLVDVLLGNGGGAFPTLPVSTNLGVGNVFGTLIAEDFNGDGIPDLAVGGILQPATTWILLGKGDGTFRAPVTYSGAVAFMGDFNGDGIPDLALDPTGGPTGNFLVGNGDGTFQPLSIPGQSSTGSLRALADFNGDGRPDLVVLNGGPGNLTVLLGAAAGANISVANGSGQSTASGTAFGAPLQVTVLNNATPVSGATVTFTAPASGASAVLSSGTATTNTSGIASITATANSTVGSYMVTANYGGVSTSFLLTNLPSGGATNLARGKTATQSSTLSGYASAGPGSAVDGNTDGNFFDGSVTHTNADPNAWWQVDLGASSSVSSIVIWNRSDCCGNRLNDYWVFISDTPFAAADTPSTLQNRAGTFSSHQAGAPDPAALILTSGAQGRYVRVQLTGTNNLSLAEVQVFSTASGPPAGANLAQGKPATQSSTLSGAAAGPAGAVDGSTDGNFFDGSVTHTNLDLNAWWQVDLGTSAIVNSILIWNRTDCCSDRLSDYWVFVSNTPFQPTDTPATLQNRAGTFSSHQTTAPNPSTTIPVVGLPGGRYVRVQLSGTGNLSLAEVQVTGIVEPVIPDLALGKPAAQSSTLPGSASAVAAAAVDGNQDGNFFDGSVTHTNLDPNAWWQVDLGASSAIASIVIWNRTDCCSTRLNDYWVFVSDTPFAPTDTPSTLQTRAGTFASHQTTSPSPSATIPAVTQGRYVRIQLTGTNNLSLAEVQVIGQ